MAQTPISQKQVDRFVELVAGVGGFRLTQHEAARAVKISERSGERLFAKPEIRARVDQLRKGRLDVDSAVRGVVADLLEAKTHDGQPDRQLRAKGAEMMLKYPAAFANLEDDDADEGLPEGVFVVYPSLLVED